MSVQFKFLMLFAYKDSSTDSLRASWRGSEIRPTSWYAKYRIPIIYSIPGACLGFLNHQDIKSMKGELFGWSCWVAIEKIHLSRRVLMILLTFELEVWKRKGVLMWVWSGLPPKQDILEMDTVVLWGIDGIWYPIFETFNQMSWKKVNDLLWSLHCPKCCFCLRIEHRPHETAHNGGWYARCWARVGGWRSLRLHTCWMLARCSVGVGGMITFLALAHIGKVNLLKPSAAAVETCKYIQVRLMGSGASWKMPFLINWWRKNARKKTEISSSLWTYVRVAMAMGS